jgi:hypothetical protein
VDKDVGVPVMVLVAVADRVDVRVLEGVRLVEGLTDAVTVGDILGVDD